MAETKRVTLYISDNNVLAKLREQQNQSKYVTVLVLDDIKKSKKITDKDVVKIVVDNIKILHEEDVIKIVEENFGLKRL